ncbi:helix-turn-helix domain-containing protein [Polaromonas sp. P5_D5]
MRASNNPPLIKAFAAELRSQRVALTLSQESLALSCGVNRTFVAKLELAQNQPTLSVLQKLSEGLGVTLPELLEATLVRYRKELRNSKREQSV